MSGTEQVTAAGDRTSQLHQWLHALLDQGGSDLHLKVGRPPIFRINGRLRNHQAGELGPGDIEKVISGILTADKLSRFRQDKDLDISYAVEGLARFRVNVFQQRGEMGAVFRLIPFHIESLEELNLPKVVQDIALSHSGLVLVTGPTGSGKSTTLAAMIQHINNRRRGHIVTIEDPIEFVHPDNLCSITQRELGSDTLSFGEGLKHVLRQNPDVVLVGEMRDLETISLAVTAAETGHLVFGTLHTIDAAQTVDRVIDVFPPNQQAQIRLQLAATLRAVVSQTLLVRADGAGRVAALEILMNTSAVASLIREGKTHQIFSLLQSGREHGMFTLDQYLKNLYVQGTITFEEACSKCSDPKEFEQLLQRNLSDE